MDFYIPQQSSLSPEEQAYFDRFGQTTPYSNSSKSRALSPEEQDRVVEEFYASQKPRNVGSFANHNPSRITPTSENWWWVWAPNAVQNIKDIGTGGVNIATHLPSHLSNFVNYEKKNLRNTLREARVAGQMLRDGNMTLGDYVNAVGRIYEANPVNATIRDSLNLIGQPYALSTNTIPEFIQAGKQGGLKGVVNKEVTQTKETAKSMLENPVDVVLDLLPGIGIANKVLKGTKAGKAINNLTDVVPGVKSQKAALKVEKDLAVKNAGIQKDLNKLDNQLMEIKKTTPDLEDLIRRAEETGDWTDVPLEAKQKLKKFSDDYNEISKKYMPATAVDPEHLTVAQNIARKNNITYREAEKRITALNDSIPKGVDKNIGLKNLAEQGDELAKQVIEAKQGFYEGRLFPVTHAGEKAASVDDLYRAASNYDDLDRIYAGRFSTREFGLTPYKEVAKNLHRPSEFLEGLGQQYLGRNIKDDLLNTGKLNGKDVVASNPKDNVYLSRVALEGDKTFEALSKSATNVPVKADDIAISKYTLKELATQTKPIGRFFANDIMNDFQNVNKASMLGSGTYLGANIIGGGLNALVASGLYTLDDLANAVKTKGVLSKNIGTFRKTSVFRDVKTPVLKQINLTNRYTTGALTEAIDRRFQNLLSEIAAHRQLRQRGISAKDRLTELDNLDAQTLGDLIEGVKAEALLNSTKTTLPRTAVEIGAAANPFWRWNDTAARSTLYMLQKHPVTANLIGNQILAKIGLDQEMQNRLNLGVKTDKPFVSYYFDERTGQIKSASIEWTPQMNTFKLITQPGEQFFKNELQAPALVKIMNATQGKDQYGRALKRPEKIPGRLTHRYDGANRYVMTDRGFVRQGTRADEVVSTFAKETIGLLNAANKVGLPIAGSLTGNQFYQPYAQSLLGSFGGNETQNNIIAGGDLRKPRSFGDAFNAFTGFYSQPYIPAIEEKANRPLTLKEGRRLMRSQRYDILKKQRGY